MRALAGICAALGLAAGLGWAADAPAGTILIVSDDTWEDSRAGRTDRPEDDLAAFLEGLGHTVHRSAPRQYRKVSSGGQGAAAALEFAQAHGVGLIIVSRLTNSGDYDDAAERVAWNSIPIPLLVMNPILAGSARWNWLATATVYSGAGYGWQNLQIDDPTHPFIVGRAADFSSVPDYSGLATPHIAKDGTGHVGHGLVVASRTPAYGSPPIHDVVIVDWNDPGGYFRGTSGQTYAARRALVAGIKYSEDEPQNPPYPLWFSHYTDNGQAILAQVVGTLLGSGPTPPRITAISLNDRPGRSASDIEPSAIGVRTIDIAFSEAVTLGEAIVTVETVAFPEGIETVTGMLSPAVTQPAPGAMRITLGDPVGAVNTWVKVTLSAAGITNGVGFALDGEPRTDSSGLGYIRNAALDLPSGDGTPGGDAVFYVGSLKGDLWGFASNPKPNGTVNSWDINGFVTRYQQLSLDADFWGFATNPQPNGIIDIWDVNGFVTAYQHATTYNLRLDALPTAPGP